jgi:uncharacterized membrane protein
MSRLPHLLALGSAAASAAAVILIRQGLRGGDAQTGFGINLVVGVIGVWGALLLAPAQPVSLPGLLLFAASGLVGTVAGRLLRFIGIDRVGASVAAALMSLTPFAAAALAILALGERLTAPVLAGTVVIVAGTVLLSGSGRRVGFRPVDVVYPLLAATCFGVVAVMRKVGVEGTGPVLGFGVNVSTGLAGFTLLTLLTGGWRRLGCTRRSAGYFVAAGVAENASVLLNILALQEGSVSVVTPLQSAAPLFVLVLSPLFLRDVERVTARIVAGTLLILAGVYAITAL